MLRWLFRLAVVALFGLAVFALWALDRTGELRELEPLGGGACTRVEGAPGAEDITIHHPSGRAFVSSLDRRALANGEAVDGKILVYDLETRRLFDATPEGLPVFRPHGISLYDAGDELRIFAVNHPSGDEHTIEILRFDGTRLQPVETVRHPLLVAPNDVVAVGARSFYATNDHTTPAGWRRFAENAIGGASGNVVHWDGEAMSVVAEDLAYANGIAASRFGREVYVAGTTRGLLYVFGRDLQSGALDGPFEIDLATGVDNLTVDRHGMLWAAAHPKLFTHFRYRHGRAERSPSQVLWIDPDQAVEPPVRPVYVDLGGEISASSVAVPYGDRLLIGSVYESFVDCERVW